MITNQFTALVDVFKKNTDVLAAFTSSALDKNIVFAQTVSSAKSLNDAVDSATKHVQGSMQEGLKVAADLYSNSVNFFQGAQSAQTSGTKGK